MPDSLQFQVNRARDPDGSKLREILNAQFEFERMQAFSLVLVWALVPIGALVWVAALWPGRLPRWAVEFGEVGWALGVVVLVLAVVRGRQFGKKARHLAAESKSPPPPDEPT